MMTFEELKELKAREIARKGKVKHRYFISNKFGTQEIGRALAVYYAGEKLIQQMEELKVEDIYIE